MARKVEVEDVVTLDDIFEKEFSAFTGSTGAAEEKAHRMPEGIYFLLENSCVLISSRKTCKSPH